MVERLLLLVRDRDQYGATRRQRAQPLEHRRHDRHAKVLDQLHRDNYVDRWRRGSERPGDVPFPKLVTAVRRRIDARRVAAEVGAVDLPHARAASEKIDELSLADPD